MTGYRRFLSYIYEYRHNGKGKNAGFVKVELRDNQLYLQINLRNLVLTPGVNVYGINKQEGEFSRVSLCRIPVNSGRGQYYYQGAERGFGDGSGILSYIGMEFSPEQAASVKYATVWGEEDIREYLFLDGKTKTHTNIKENTAAREETEVKIKEAPESEMNPLEADTARQESLHASQEKDDSVVLKDQEVAFEKIPLWENPIWTRMKRDNPSVDTLREDMFITCVKGHPGDLGHLPKKNWIFGNNSYLLYGYLRYHHVLFMQTRDNQFLIGIPGHQEQEEEILAHLCGFSEFHPAQGEGDDFGYWCAPIYLTESSQSGKIG